jgi:hypothetical protein
VADIRPSPRTSRTPAQAIQTIFGDGGHSGFDVANPQFRFHTYLGNQIGVDFSGGTLAAWNWIADTFFINPEPADYIPLSGPSVCRTMYASTSHVWRAKTLGVGSPINGQKIFS